MADVVLYVHTKFSKGLSSTFRNKDRIIAEALRSTLLFGNLAIDDAFEESALAFF